MFLLGYKSLVSRAGMTSASLFAVLEIKRFVQVKTLAADGGKGGCLQKPPLKKEVENLFSKTISVFTLAINVNNSCSHRKRVLHSLDVLT